MADSCLYQIRCFGGQETLKSSILGGKQLFDQIKCLGSRQMGYNVKRSRPKDNRSLLNKANLFVLSINTQKNTYY